MTQRSGGAFLNRVQKNLSGVRLLNLLIGADIDHNRNFGHPKSIPVVLRIFKAIPIEREESYAAIQVPEQVQQPFGLAPCPGSVDPLIAVA